MTEGKAGGLELAYEADKALVLADPELSPAEMGREITRLTDELLEDEREAGIRWEPVFGLEVQTHGGGGVVLSLPKDERGNA